MQFLFESRLMLVSKALVVGNCEKTVESKLWRARGKKNKSAGETLSTFSRLQSFLSHKDIKFMSFSISSVL